MGPDLIAASFAVLRKHRQLILFPIFSLVSVLLVAVAFLGFGLVSFHGTAGYPILFAGYCLSAFGMIFFNCALAACAQECLNGGTPTLIFGLQRALERVGSIFVWAVISSTVGIFLKVVERRLPLAGKIVVWICGAAWGMTTYLVIPVLIVEDVNAFEAVDRSVQLLRDTWGQQVVSGIRFGWRFLLFVVPGVILGAIGANYYLPVLALAFVYIAGLITVMAAAKSIFQVALYRYAAGSPVPGWPQDALSSAFRRA
jgi:hypothetical protein